MPIAFRRPTAKPAAQDWFTLQKPDDVKAESDKTLYDLLCVTERQVPLPACDDLDWSVVNQPPIRKGQVVVDSNPKIKLKLQPCHGGVSLDFEYLENDETYRLQEQIKIDMASTSLRRQGAPWGSQKLRFGAMFEKLADKPQLELNKLGFGVNGRIPKDSAADIFSKLMGVREGVGITVDRTEKILAKWADGSPPETLEEWRQQLLSRVAIESHPFAQGLYARYDNTNQRVENPGIAEDMKRKDGEGEREFTGRFRHYQEDHKKKQQKWEEWRKVRDQFVMESARKPEELKAFLDQAANRNEGSGTTGTKGIDPDIEAVSVLLQLDGLIIAKKYRKELEQFLNQVPVAAIFEGEVTQVWNIDGLGDVDVPVARIRPAPVLPPSTGSEHTQAPAAVAQ
jgi:hypothetical protein